MAWAPCASSSAPPPSSSSTTSPSFVVARRASPTSLKLPRRKNHLRSKILKTLTTPPQPTSTLQSRPRETLRNLSEFIEVVEQTELVLYSNEEELTEHPGESEENRESSVHITEHPAESDGNRESSVHIPASTETKLPEIDAAFTARSVLEIALYFVGLLVVQTVCTVVFVMVSQGGVFDKSGNGLEEDELGVSRAGNATVKKKDGFWFRDRILESKGVGADATVDVAYVDRIQVEEKIAEIRAMAKKAREIETKKLSSNGAIAFPEDLNFGSKTNVEKEVASRLNRMPKKKLQLVEEKPVRSLNYEAEVEDNKISESSDAANAKEQATGQKKKKLKLRTPPVMSRNYPKGFGRGKDHSVVNRSRTNGGKASSLSIERGIQETSPELAEPRKLIEFEMGNSQESLKENESERMPNKVGYERDIQNELWWMNLPYALFGIYVIISCQVILMRKGSDNKASRGLYSLKMHEGSSSYTVAFEDQSDAKNFCYILETFFEDLGDFRAVVLPLSISELNDAAKLSATKVIVVRKGQLKLYAGQPLADVERTLRSFIK